MPSFDIVKKSNPENSFRVNSIASQFDLKIDEIKEVFSGNIDIENTDWNIGLIVGASGTGKSTVLKEVFGQANKFNYKSKSVIDDMPNGLSVKDITKVFTSVGFSSPPSWLKPYSVLSNGERMRCDLARSIMLNEEITLFDEFTSVVDRNVAKTASLCINKYVKKNDSKFVAASCHYDIIDWLQPDWIFDTNKFQFFFVENTKNNKLNYQYTSTLISQYGTLLKSITI